ncbi:MAG TPA: DUF3341 domain-containing protein [Gemmatimonadaceae bacterium]|nr:DUF3341 domain-containing protein [Gemmatimonadaceae bacterium]
MSKDFIARDGALFAEFDDAELARRALDNLSARGYRNLETFFPFPMTSDQATNQLGWPALAMVVFALAAVGAAVGYFVQWYANAVSYPLNIGGRPAHAVLPFFVSALESLLLFGGVAAFVALLVALRLPRLWRPVYEIEGFERASIDRYWIAVGMGLGGDDDDFARIDRELRSMNAVRVVRVTEET